MSATERLVQAVRNSVEAGRCLAAECYRDPAFFELEVERVLRPGWHAVARWDHLPDPGDYASVDLCGEPLLLVRDEARALRVFSRVCRHRAHVLVQGSGNTKRFVCPYHRWSYRLDGALHGAPLMDKAEGFDPAQCGLPELRTDLWHGFVLTNLDPDAEPISERLGALAARLDPHGLEKMVTIGTLDFDSPWNWKVMVDNFMESYHHLGAHTATLQKSNPARNTHNVDVDGPCSLLANPGTGGAPDFYVAQVFPTMLIAVFAGAPIGTWYEMQIDRHDHIHLRIHMLSTEEVAADPNRVELQSAGTRAIHMEDIPVCEGVQRGLSSHLWQPGLLSEHEKPLALFHRYLADCLVAR